MTSDSERSLQTLGAIARGHAGASSGERAAWDILRNLQDGTPVDFADCLVRLDGSGKHAVLLLLADLAVGKTGLTELRR